MTDQMVAARPAHPMAARKPSGLDEPAEQGRQEGHEGRFGPAHDGVIELAQVGHVVEKSEPRAKERGRHREEGKRLQHAEDEAAVDTGTGCTG